MRRRGRGCSSFRRNRRSRRQTARGATSAPSFAGRLQRELTAAAGGRQPEGSTGARVGGDGQDCPMSAHGPGGAGPRDDRSLGRAAPPGALSGAAGSWGGRRQRARPTWIPLGRWTEAWPSAPQRLPFRPCCLALADAGERRHQNGDRGRSRTFSAKREFPCNSWTIWLRDHSAQGSGGLGSASASPIETAHPRAPNQDRGVVRQTQWSSKP